MGGNPQVTVNYVGQSNGSSEEKGDTIFNARQWSKMNGGPINYTPDFSGFFLLAVLQLQIPIPEMKLLPQIFFSYIYEELTDLICEEIKNFGAQNRVTDQKNVSRTESPLCARACVRLRACVRACLLEWGGFRHWKFLNES